MSGQPPMAKRMQDMLEDLQQDGPISVHRLERTVLKRLIKKGKARIRNDGNARYHVGGRSIKYAVAMEVPPIKIESESLGPYAKRRAALEESGLPYKGKTWGKVRVDLPREEREKKIDDKKKMWNKLKAVIFSVTNNLG